MTPEDFLKGLAPTTDLDQGIAGFRSIAHMLGAFYNGLIAEGVGEEVAVEMSCELLRCTIGDHKASA